MSRIILTLGREGETLGDAERRGHLHKEAAGYFEQEYPGGGWRELTFEQAEALINERLDALEAQRREAVDQRLAWRLRIREIEDRLEELARLERPSGGVLSPADASRRR